MLSGRKFRCIIACLVCLAVVLFSVPAFSAKTKARSSKKAPAQPQLSVRELTELGYKNLFGKGVPVNEAAAFKYYLQAANLGDIGSQLIVGDMYLEGLGVKRNDSEGAKWLLRAAKGGLSDAQCDIGFCYCYGIGVRQDINEGLNWLEKADKQGNPRAKKIAEQVGKEIGVGIVTDMVFPRGQAPIQNRGGSAGRNANTCPRCGGTGVCPACGGQGGTSSILFGYYHCNACQDTGLCYTCRGAGVLR